MLPLRYVHVSAGYEPQELAQEGGYRSQSEGDRLAAPTLDFLQRQLDRSQAR